MRGSGWARWPLGVVRPRRRSATPKRATTARCHNRSGAKPLRRVDRVASDGRTAFGNRRFARRVGVSGAGCLTRTTPMDSARTRAGFPVAAFSWAARRKCGREQRGAGATPFRIRGQPLRYVVSFLGVGIALKSTIRSGIGGRSRSGFDCFDSPVRRRPAALRSPLRFRHSQHHFIACPSGLTKLLRSL